ncbi:MAG: ATP-binding domain-containing protein, partial [Ketobacter sp.]|nr:ATP-binding domain-containing protein [Ketobacter sp.]
WQLGPLGNFHLVDEPTDATGDIYCTTIHKFKGLESPVVILAEIDNDQIWNLETILYVGCSRARNHLILLTAADLSDKIKTKLAE